MLDNAQIVAKFVLSQTDYFTNATWILVLAYTENGDKSLLFFYRMGCGALDYREQAQKIELKTGGMSVSPHIIPDDSHLDVYEQVN